MMFVFFNLWMIPQIRWSSHILTNQFTFFLFQFLHLFISFLYLFYHSQYQLPFSLILVSKSSQYGVNPSVINESSISYWTAGLILINISHPFHIIIILHPSIMFCILNQYSSPKSRIYQTELHLIPISIWMLVHLLRVIHS